MSACMCPFCGVPTGINDYCCEDCVDTAEKIEMAGGQQEDHNCMDHRERALFEGDDVLHECCAVCGRIRYETDGVRPMAWFLDRTNPTGHRYAYPDPVADPKKPTVWKYP